MFAVFLFVDRGICRQKRGHGDAAGARPRFHVSVADGGQITAVSVTIAMLKHASHPSGGRVIRVLRCVPNVTDTGDRADFVAVCMLARLLVKDCSLLTRRNLLGSPLAEDGGIVRAR